jgi:signal transduction histidine kinase
MESAETQKAAYINLAEKSINKLDSFILDLTNFSRNSRMEVEREKIDFQEVISECLDNLKYMEHADKVDIRVDIQEDKPFMSDIGRMSILFQNLISNAIKYQRIHIDSFVDIKVRTNSEGASIEVKDNGKGIQAEYVGRIFEMFFRASEDSYGSGLGLYITRQVVEKLGGRIEVDSEYNEGSSFRVFLPHPEEQAINPA